MDGCVMPTAWSWNGDAIHRWPRLESLAEHGWVTWLQGGQAARHARWRWVCFADKDWFIATDLGFVTPSERLELFILGWWFVCKVGLAPWFPHMWLILACTSVLRMEWRWHLPMLPAAIREGSFKWRALQRKGWIGMGVTRYHIR